MRRLMLFFIVLFMASSVYAQSTAPTTAGIVVSSPIALPPVPVTYVSTNSIVDAGGNVLIFDNVLSGIFGATAASLSTALPTRVNVISSDGRTANAFSFSGSFQILGVGHDAVYAIVDSLTAGTNVSLVISRKLVALSVVAGTLPATLPSITLTSNQDVKLSAGAGPGNTDVIAVISGTAFLTPSSLLASGNPSPHVISLYTSDGTTFTANPNNPISTH